MKFLALTVALAGSAAAAPSYVAPAAAAVVGHAVVGHAHVGHAAVGYKPATVAAVDQVHLGQPISQTYVQHGVVGHQPVQVGSQPVQVGHQYGVVGRQAIPQAPYTYVAGEPKSYSETRPLPVPALPAVGSVAPIIPPAPVNYGPAPADTVTVQEVAAPVRTHTRITPRVTRIEPKLNVQQVPYEVRVNVPVPVQRDVIVQKNVPEPYQVNVPHPVPVAAPYAVNRIQTVLQTPVIKQRTYSVHAPAVAAVAAHY